MFFSSETSGVEAPSLRIPARQVEKRVLPNGLTLLVEEDASVSVASVQAWCLTGSVHEDRLLGSGLSHILEHMLFKGTATRSPNSIANEVQNEGGYINAYTSFDRTVYWIDVPKAGALQALEILADVMVHASLPEDEYSKEMEVIRREFAMGYDNPDRMASQLLFQTAYREHPYQHPVIGHLDVYNQLTREDVLRYYQTRYVPNNLVFVVTGAVSTEEIFGKLAALFAEQPRRVLPAIYIPIEPPQTGRREVHQEFATELSRLLLAWHVPGVDHPDVPALEVLAMILGGGRSSRLYRTLREEKGLVHGISCSSYTPYYPGILVISATLPPAHRENATTDIASILDELIRDGISMAELQRAQKMWLASQLGSLATTAGRAADLGSSWLLTRTVDFGQRYVEAVQQVTMQQVQDVAAKYLRAENQTIVSLNPPGSLALASSAAEKIAPGAVQKFTLSNGLRLLIREDHRLPLVSAHAVFKGGLLKETARTSGISRLMAKTLLKGTQTRTAAQISDEIESVGGNISSAAGNNSFTVSVEATQADLRLVIDLLSDVLLHPTFPEQALKREKEGQLAAQQAEQEQMTAIARNLLRKTLYGSHPYGLRSLGTLESVLQISPADLAAYHAELAVAANGVLALFGDVQTAEVIQLCEQYFASLSTGQPALAEIEQPAELLVSQKTAALEDKAQAVLMVGFPTVDLFSPDKPALDLIDEASSDLGSRFFVSIRENLGLAYFVGSNQLLGLAPGIFSFYVGTDPQKIDLVEAALLAEIEKLAAEGLTAAELERSKKKLLGQQEIESQSNDALGYHCALSELYGQGFDYYLGNQQRINAVTLEEVQTVARKYFHNRPRVITVVHPPIAADEGAENPET